MRNYPQEFIDADTIFRRRLAEQEAEVIDCERRLGIARERIRDLYADYYKQMSTITMHATSEAIERGDENLMRECLQPFAFFAKQWDSKPLRGLDDEIYSIHAGTEHAASIRLSDCRNAKRAIERKKR